ncbi:hypothetical protein D3C72_2143000 [compost metagenome]
MTDRGDGALAIGRLLHHAADVVADRDAVIGCQRHAHLVPETRERMVVVLGEHDARPARHAQGGQHHLLVIGRTIGMNDVEPASFDQPAQARAVLEPRRRARLVLHFYDRHAGDGLGVAV